MGNVLVLLFVSDVLAMPVHTGLGGGLGEMHFGSMLRATSCYVTSTLRKRSGTDLLVSCSINVYLVSFRLMSALGSSHLVSAYPFPNAPVAFQCGQPKSGLRVQGHCLCGYQGRKNPGSKLRYTWSRTGATAMQGLSSLAYCSKADQSLNGVRSILGLDARSMHTAPKPA